MARLILATVEGQQVIDLRLVNSLGRHPNNSVQLLDKIVSKEHCIIEVRDAQFLLRDLGSLNGTYINGERVRGEQFLRHGDEIALGSTRARFDDGSGPVSAVPLPISPGAIQQPLPTTPAGQAPAPAQQGWGAPQQFPSQQAMAAVAQPPRFSSQQAMAAVPQQYPPPSTANPQQPRPPPPQHMASQPPPIALATAPLGAPAPARFAPSPQRTVSGTPIFRPPSFSGTRVDMLDSARAIGTQIAATAPTIQPFDVVSKDPQQLRVDYERLRITWELTRDISLERDLDKLLEKILLALFKFVKADRGVILLRDEQGTLVPRAARRRDGTDAPIQVSSTILNHVITERAGVLTHDASMDFAASKGRSMILNRISSAIVVPLLHEKDVLGALWLDSESLAQFQQKDLEIITAVANQAAMFIENNLLARKIEHEIVTRERFSRLLSPNVAEEVMSGKLEVKLGGTLVNECTVFNSDIRGFTRMSEGSTPEVMIEMLNGYFERMVEAIFKYEGTLDKFMGDGIMAIWGAPAKHPDDAVRAVQSSLEQMKALAEYNTERAAVGLSELEIGIGIHTGALVAGYVGSSKALSYTVIGDTANTSARICGIAKSGQVIVSESTLSRLGDRFDVEELPAAALKGKEKPLRIFNVLREKQRFVPPLPR
jgi:adenylate cyclase